MRTQVWAHRGASGYMPENTLQAFQKAIDLGADGIELDIQLTKDGHLVVCHDEEIDRTSNGTGYLKEYTLAQLKQFDFSYTYSEFGKVEIPTMEEVLDLIKPTNLIINIELKTGIVDYPCIEEKIIALVHEKEMDDRVIYSSFNHYTIQKIQKLDAQAKVAFLYCDGIIDMATYGNKYHVDALHPAAYNVRLPHFMEKCKEYGIAVNVWTVNTVELAKTCITYGVNAIITNYPDKIKKVIEDDARI